jgi:hypothetical protein
MKPKNGFVSNVWQTVSKQKWNDITKQWVITTLTAPAGVISNDIIKKMGLEQQSTTSGLSSDRR